jgi:hypothetical protein
MRSKFLLSAVIAVAVLGMALPAGAAAPINGTGTSHCAIVGIIKFKPPLKAGGTTPTLVTVKATLSGCTGTGNGAHIASGKTIGTLNQPTNDCTALLGTSSNPLTATVKWKVPKGQPKLNPSTVKYTSTTGGAGTPATFDAAGTVTAGSFHGNTASAHAVLQETAGDLGAACLGKKGIKQIHITTGSHADLT